MDSVSNSAHSQVPAATELLAKSVVDAAFKIHKTFGPGLLEGVYERCLEIELRKRGMAVLSQVFVPVVFEGTTIPDAFRLDLVVNEELVIEVKAVEKVLPLHKAQLLTYLRLIDKRLGLLINFNVELIKEGISRVVR